MFLSGTVGCLDTGLATSEACIKTFPFVCLCIGVAACQPAVVSFHGDLRFSRDVYMGHRQCPAACRQFRDMLREHLKAQRTDSEHSEGTQPIERQSLDSATSAEEPDSAASAPGPGTAGQDGPSQNTGSRPKRHVSFGRPPVHCLSGSLPASHSGSVHMQVTSTHSRTLIHSQPLVPSRLCSPYLTCHLQAV